MAAAKTAEVVKDEAYWEELVEFMPPYDRLHRDEIFISVNGENIRINPKAVHESGEPIKIKRKFVACFQDGERQKMKAEDFMEANEYKD